MAYVVVDVAVLAVNAPTTIHRLATTPWFRSGQYAHGEAQYPEGTQMVRTRAVSGDGVEATGNYRTIGGAPLRHPSHHERPARSMLPRAEGGLTDCWG